MKTILVVDDVIEIVRLLEVLLQGMGFQVATGRNGEEGLSALESIQPKPVLILSNLMMPQMDGMAFLQEVRQQPQLEDVPFVLVTAHPSETVAETAFEEGANALLPKPFQLADIKSLLNDFGLFPSAN